jgi:hypothetical protein
MLSKKYICGILLFLCFLTITCVSAADDQASTDNPVAMGTSDSSYSGQDSGVGLGTSSLKDISSSNVQLNTSSNSVN